MDTGDTAWVLASAALVLLMTPGLAFFYGGMVRAKNVLDMLMMSFGTIALVSVALGALRLLPRLRQRGNGLIGDLRLRRPAARWARASPGYADSFAHVIPSMVFVVFQADVRDHHRRADHRRDRRPVEVRRRVVVHRLWSTLVYFPVAHWVFFDGASRAGGWIANNLRRARLRRRHRGAHQRRCRRPRAGARARQAARLGRRADAAAQPAVRAARRRPAVVRLVRLQRRLRAGRQPARRVRVREHQHRHRRRAARLDRRGEAPRRQGHHARRRVRRGRRPGRDHPGAGFVSPLGSIAVGADRRRRAAPSRSRSRTCCGSTTRSTSSPCTSSAASSARSCVGLFATTDTNALGADGLFYGGGWTCSASRRWRWSR